MRNALKGYTKRRIQRYKFQGITFNENPNAEYIEDFQKFQVNFSKLPAKDHRRKGLKRGIELIS